MKITNFLLHREYTSNSKPSIIPKDFILKDDPSDEDKLALGILFKWQFRSEEDYEAFIYKNIREIQFSRMMPHWFSNMYISLLTKYIQGEALDIKLSMADLYLKDITAYEKAVFQNPDRYFFRIGKWFILETISILIHLIVAVSFAIAFFTLMLSAAPEFSLIGWLILCIDMVWCAAWL